MGKSIITVLSVLGLATVALSAPLWFPALLGFAGTNSDAIQGLTNLVQLVLWAVTGTVGLFGFLRVRERNKSQAEEPETADRRGTGDINVGGSAINLMSAVAPSTPP